MSESEPFDEASKDYRRGQNWVSIMGPGQVQGEPAYCLSGLRRKDGMTLS